MKNVKQFLYKTEKGISIFEVLLAMTVVLLILPFAYNKINDTTIDIQNVSIARYITEFNVPISNYVQINQKKWPEQYDEFISVNDFDKILKPYGLSEIQIKFSSLIRGKSLFLEKYTDDSGNSHINAYLILYFNHIKQLRLNKISQQLGNAGGVLDNTGIARSLIGDWSIDFSNNILMKTDNLYSDDVLIYKIDLINRENQDFSYLYRLKIGSKNNLNTMETNLFMNMNNLNNVFNIVGKNFNLNTLNCNIVNIDKIQSKNINFNSDVNFVPSDNNVDLNKNINIKESNVQAIVSDEKSIIKTHQLVGDLFYSDTQDFYPQGEIYTINTTINDTLYIGNNLSIETSNSLNFDNSELKCHTLYSKQIETSELKIDSSIGISVPYCGGIYFSDNTLKYSPVCDSETKFLELNQLILNGSDNIDKLSNTGTTSDIENIEMITRDWINYAQ